MLSRNNRQPLKLVVIVSLGLAACSGSSNGCNNSGSAPIVPHLGLNPCCALVAGEIGTSIDPRILISQRRGPPAEDRWELLADHHIPSGPPPTTPTPPTAVWRSMIDIKEVTLPVANGGYQVHVLVLEFDGVFSDMVQSPDASWPGVRKLLGYQRLVPTGQTGGPLGTDVGRTGTFRRISGASVGGKLHVCAIEAQGQVVRNVFDPAADQFVGWDDLELNIGSETGRFIDVACAAVQDANGAEELHVCGVTDDGFVWHAKESPSGTLSPFGDVKAQMAVDVGLFNRVDCAGNQGQLHLVGITRDGRAWHTVRIPSQWRPFENVTDQARDASTPAKSPGVGFRDVAIGFCNHDVPPNGTSDVSQLNVVLTGPQTTVGGPSPIPSGIWHTIRSTNPVSWTTGGTPQQWRPIRDLGAQINRTVSSPLPLTSNPTLWGGFSIGFRPFRPY